MARLAIPQGDGRWAVFSTVVDFITHANLTPEQVTQEVRFGSAVQIALAVEKMHRGERPQIWDDMSIRSAIAWCWHGNNGVRDDSEAPDPSDPLNSACTANESMTDDEVAAAIAWLIDNGHTSGPWPGA